VPSPQGIPPNDGHPKSSPISSKKRSAWCATGKPVVLREQFSRQSQTGPGFVTMTPGRQKLNFRFTIFSGAIASWDVIAFLREIHRYYGRKAPIIPDRPSSHISARNFFERVRPDWFEFEHLPPYSPESNPAEQCRRQMKNVSTDNFVPSNVAELQSKALECAQALNNDPMLLASFFHHAKLAP